jgi:hypothetical protein
MKLLIKQFLILVFCTTFSLLTYAVAEDEYCNEVKRLKQNTKHLELQEKSVEVAMALCYNMNMSFEGALFSAKYLRRNTNETAFMQEVSELIQQTFPNNKFPGTTDFAKSWSEPIADPTETAKQAHFPAFRIDTSSRMGADDSNIQTYKIIGRNQRSEFVFKTNNQAQQDYCQDNYKTSCDKVMTDIENAVELYNYYVKNYVAADVKAAIGYSLLNWDKYKEEAPVIGFFSRIVTTWRYKDHFYNNTNPWPGPPPAQIRALEVSLVLDHFPNGEDGNKTKPGAAVEWLGYNDWNNDVVPWGVGLASVYVDRQGAKSMGHGLIFHFKNEYSLGVVRRGDQNTLFFNINFAEWFGENKTKLADYKRDKIPSWLQ